MNGSPLSNSCNLLDATNAWTLDLADDSRLKGIPEDARLLFRETAKQACKEGYRITLQFPSYIPVLQYAEDRSLREEAYRAFSTRASELGPDKFDNTPVIRETLELRKKLASLLGFRNYAEYSLATKMAETPGTGGRIPARSEQQEPPLCAEGYGRSCGNLPPRNSVSNRFSPGTSALPRRNSVRRATRFRMRK